MSYLMQVIIGSVIGVGLAYVFIRLLWVVMLWRLRGRGHCADRIIPARLFACQSQKSESAGQQLEQLTALFEPRIYLEFMKSKLFASVGLGMLPSGGAPSRFAIGRERGKSRSAWQPAALSQVEPPIFWACASIAEAVMNKCHREMIQWDAR